MPLARDGSMDNLFTVLQGVAPQLRELARASPSPPASVCEGLRLRWAMRAPGAPRWLSLSC
jgi:hypothetical protein